MTNPQTSRRLRWWFWLLLFAPAILSVVGTSLTEFGSGSEEQFGWMVSVNLLGALPLNGICSACCAAHLSRARTGQARLAWLIFGTLAFFALNVIVALAGCAGTAVLMDIDL